MKLRKSLLIIMILGSSSLLLMGLLFIAPGEKETPGPYPELIIYDVHPDCPRIIKDDGSIAIADYLRIRNMSDKPCDLSGLYLSDLREKYGKLPLQGMLEGNGSRMVTLDPSINFALKKGESVYLSDYKGNIIFEYTADMKPDEPVFSADSGFYDTEFELYLSAPEKLSIHYTLDGSAPDEDSPVYTGPIHVYDRSGEENRVVSVQNTIRHYFEEEYYDEVSGFMVKIDDVIDTPVDKAFIVRAVAMDDSGNKSDIITREFFFCGDKYKNIISVVADPDELFGDHGIAAVGKEYDDWYLGGQEGAEPEPNYMKSGREWEIAADMDYFRDKNKVFGQKCGLRVQGRTTRFRRIRNFQLRARNCYSGSEVFDCDIFENEPYRSRALILDDSFGESFFLSLVEDEKILKQKTTDRVAFFLNGEFWNDIYIHQKLDVSFFSDHLQLPAYSFFVLSESFVDISSPENPFRGDEEKFYVELDGFAEKNDLSQDKNYKVIGKMMDIDSYIDYLAINTWAGNNDWGEMNNDIVWRVYTPSGQGNTDGRFRWVLHDSDAVFRDNRQIGANEAIESSVLYTNLTKNADFRQKFKERIKELGETTFSEENIRRELESGKWDEPEKEQIAEFMKNRREEMNRIIDEELF